MRVQLDRAAEESLAYIMRDDEETGYKIVDRIGKMAYDPYPNTFSEDLRVVSQVVRFLSKQGYDVRRLKSTEFYGYRVFYFVIEENDLVIVCDVVIKDKRTYSNDAPHIKNIKECYRRHVGPAQ